jgi:hypothetical protein
MSSYIIIDSSDAVTMQKPGLAGGEWFHTLSEAVEYYMDRGWECQGAPRPSSCTRLVQGPHPEEAYEWVEEFNDPRWRGLVTRRYAKFVPKQASMSVWGGDALNNKVYGVNTSFGARGTHYSLAFNGHSQCLTHVPTSKRARDVQAVEDATNARRQRLAAE